MRIGLPTTKICERLDKYKCDHNLYGLTFVFQNRYKVVGSGIADMIESDATQKFILNGIGKYDELAAKLFDLSMCGWNISSIRKEEAFLVIVFQTCRIWWDATPEDVFLEHGEWKQVMTTNIDVNVVERILALTSN